MRGLETTAEKMIKALGPRLGALHVHDNDKHNDSHQIPFTMQIDFDKMIAALKDVGYRGDMTLECDAYIHSFINGDNDKVFEGVKNLADAANKLVEMFKA
jgi:sugar phosphate isomerase/epimerase